MVRFAPQAFCNNDSTLGTKLFNYLRTSPLPSRPPCRPNEDIEFGRFTRIDKENKKLNQSIQPIAYAPADLCVRQEHKK